MTSIDASYGGPPQSVPGLAVAMNKIGAFNLCLATHNRPENKLQLLGEDCLKSFPVESPESWYYSNKLRQLLAQEITSFDLMTIHEMWSYPQYAAKNLAIKHGIPLIVTPHGTLEPWRVNQMGALKRLKKHVYLRTLGRGLISRAACYHAITPNEIEGIRMVGFKGPISVVPNGINPEDFENLPPAGLAEAEWPELKGRRVVLFMSRLSVEKGLDELIPAWQMLCQNKKAEDALLVLAGPDDKGYRAIVEAMLQSFGLENKVLMTGMVSGEKKRALISRADIFTLPSYSEGFSMAILENMAAGKPVLITPGCNFPDVAEINAGLCVAPERGAVASGLGEMLSLSEEALKAMGERGKNHVCKNFSWNALAKKMLSVYNAVIHGREPSLFPKPWEESL